MILDQSKSNSERGKDKNFDLCEEAGLTPLLGMTQSFEDCDWLVKKEIKSSESAIHVCVITLLIEGCDRPKSSLLYSCICPLVKYVNVEITSISGTMAFLRGVWDVSVSLITSVSNMILARSNVWRLINWLSYIVCNTFFLPLHYSSIFSTAKETLKPLKSLVLDIKTSY